jgi:hypothetical protein
MKAKDKIFILDSDDNIKTSTITKIGSKWGYFGRDSKFLIEDMSVRDCYGNCYGIVFLSEQSANDYLEAKEISREIYKKVTDYSFRPESYSLSTLRLIMMLLNNEHNEDELEV